jgi:hypothetical protein
MAEIIKIRGSVFIGGMLYLPATLDANGTTYEFQGDAREFTPYAGNSGRCRVEQEVVF